MGGGYGSSLRSLANRWCRGCRLGAGCLGDLETSFWLAGDSEAEGLFSSGGGFASPGCSQDFSHFQRCLRHVWVMFVRRLSDPEMPIASRMHCMSKLKDSM